MGRNTIPGWIKRELPSSCVNCGSTNDLRYHHIVPVIYGGRTIPGNIAVLCVECHSLAHYGKSDGMSHSDAIRAGIKAAKERGVKMGRAGFDHEPIIRMIAENSTQFNRASQMTEGEIMEMAGVKNVCYHKCKNELLEAMDADEWPYDWEKPKENYGIPVYARKIRRLRGDVS